jgi:tRNA nucleotidyltransferase (CCA-adding enzyme)
MATKGCSKADWSHFSHEGDVGIRGFGAAPAAAFENAARAMTAVVAPLEAIRAEETATVTCRTPDLEILLVDWLNAVIYEMATRGMLFHDFHVEIDGGELRGEMRGEAVDRERHEPSVELKGATLTELKVAQCEDGRWLAQCVVDV